MPFGNEDPIDRLNRERIRILAEGLRSLLKSFERSTSLTLLEKERAILDAREALETYENSFVFRV